MAPVAATSRLTPNTDDVIDGKYRIKRVIGAGGMGVVVAAEHLELGCTVALKFMQGHSSGNRELRARFLREARTVCRLRTEHVAAIRDIGWLGDETPYLVMEYLEGEDLATVIEARAPLSLGEAASYVAQACEGLAEAHDLSIVHRDVKPANLFLTSRLDGRSLVKVLDFGIATADPLQSLRDGIRTEGLLGSVPYASPEQLLGQREITCQSDIYSLGVVFYELLTGLRPHRSRNVAGLISEIVGHAPIPLRNERPDLPPSVEYVIERCLAKKPVERWATADELAAALGEFASDDGAAGRPISSGRRSSAASQFVDADDDDGSDALPVSAEYRAGLPQDRLRALSERMIVYVAVNAERPGCCAAFDGLRGAARRQKLQHVHVYLDVHGNAEAIRHAGAQLREICERDCSNAHFVSFLGSATALTAVRSMLQAELEQYSESPASGSGLRGGARRTLSARTDELLELAEADAHAQTSNPAFTQVRADLDRMLDELRQVPLPWPRQRLVVGVDVTLAGGDSLTASGIAQQGELGSLLRQALRLSAGLENADLFVARETMVRVRDFNASAKVQTLIEGGPGSLPPSKTAGVAGTQQRVHDHLLAALRQAESAGRWVVTGQAGVGKSTVLRALATRLAADYAADPASSALPLVALLPLISLAPNEVEEFGRLPAAERPRKLFQCLFQHWGVWAEGVHEPELLTLDYVTSRLRFGETVLILDGVDEFLTNNPCLAVHDIHDLLTHVGRLSERNRLAVVLGVRSSMPGVKMLGTSSSHLVEVQRLSVSEASRWFPETARVLESIQNSEVRDLVLTPLILRALGPRIGDLSQSAVKSTASLLEEALAAVVEESGLLDVRSSNGSRFETEEWMGALSLAAWIFFTRFLGQIRIDELSAPARDIAAIPRESREAAAWVTTACQLLEDPATSAALRRRSIFYPAGPQAMRFVHRQWQDFLAARYFASCVASGSIEDFSTMGLSLPMFKMAGELLADRGFRLDAAFAERVLKRGKQISSPLVSANLVALLSSSRIPMDGPAVESLLQAIDGMGQFSRLIALNGLSYRALRNDDPAAADLRHKLVPLYRSFVAGELPYAKRGSVLFSVAWLHLKAFHHHFGTPAPEGAWQPPVYDAANAGELSVVCTRAPSGLVLLPVNRSIQAAFLQSMYMVRADPHRPISVAHYLYYLVLARRHAMHIAEISIEFPAILDPTGPTAQALMNYRPVPEVRQLFEYCCAMHGNPQTTTTDDGSLS